MIRVWVLRLFAIAAILFGAYLLYDAYEELTWGRRALSEAGLAGYSTGPLRDQILAGAAETAARGTAAKNTGLLLIAAGIIMEALASIIEILERSTGGKIIAQS